jgi:hypothetical protein
MYECLDQNKTVVAARKPLTRSLGCGFSFKA